MSVIPEISYDSSRVKNTFVRSEVITPEIYNELNKLAIDLTSNNNLLDENAVLIREQLTSSKDLNSAIHQGVYSFTSEAINIPFSGSNGVIFVTNTEKTAQGTSVITQLALCSDNSIYTRTKNKGENFTNWYKLAFTTDNVSSATKAKQDILGNQIDTTYATLSSPNFTGMPTAPTAEIDTNNTQIATTQFVQSLINSKGTISGVSINNNGWERHSNGLLIAWGNGKTNSNFSFPITFNNVFVVVGTEGLNASGFSSISFSRVNNNGGYIYSSSLGEAVISYIAFGN